MNKQKEAKEADEWKKGGELVLGFGKVARCWIELCRPRLLLSAMFAKLPATLRYQSPPHRT